MDLKNNLAALSLYRKQLDKLITERDLELFNKEKEEKESESLQSEVNDLTMILEILQAASKVMYSNLSVKLGNIITEGLSLVFPEDKLTFNIEFVDRRNQIEADIYFSDADGYKLDPVKEVGGGITDFTSFLLRTIYIKLSKYEDIIFADEPSKFIDRSQITNATHFLAKVCEDLKFKVVVVTHIPEMFEVSKVKYHIKKINDISVIRETKSE